MAIISCGYNKRLSFHSYFITVRTEHRAANRLFEKTVIKLLCFRHNSRRRAYGSRPMHGTGGSSYSRLA
jgi:hypothetical protein